MYIFFVNLVAGTCRTLVIYFAIWPGSVGFSVHLAKRKKQHTEGNTCKDYVSVVSGMWVIKPRLGRNCDPLIRVLGGGGQQSQSMCCCLHLEHELTICTCSNSN